MRTICWILRCESGAVLNFSHTNHLRNVGSLRCSLDAPSTNHVQPLLSRDAAVSAHYKMAMVDVIVQRVVVVRSL